MKKLLTVLLTATMLLCMVMVPVSASEDIKCGNTLAQALANADDGEKLDVYVEYQFSVTPKEELEQRAREICNYPEDERSATMEQVNSYIRTYRRLVHEDHVNSATAVMKKLGIYDNIVMMRYSPDCSEHVPVVDIDALFYGIPSAPCRFMLSAAKIRELLTKNEVTFADLYVLENLQWYKDFYQKTDEPEPTEGRLFASAEVNNHQNKLSPQLIEEINESAEETVCVYISLLPCTGEAEIEKAVSEKYTWSDENEYLKYYRQELSSVVGAYVQQFVDDHGDLLNRILVQPNSAEFVIAEVSKGNVEELAKLDIVRDIDLWSDTIEVISEDDPDELYRNAFVEWSVSQYGKNCLADGYSYKELYRHVADNQTDWVLVNAKYLLPTPEVETWVRIGGRNIMSGSLCAPFKCGYGVYDVNENCFYDLDEIADDHSQFNGLMEALESLKIGNPIGDANLDNTVSISDVTCIQRSLAEYDHFTKYQNGLSDVNKDGEVNIADATDIQRYLAQLITDFG